MKAYAFIKSGVIPAPPYLFQVYQITETSQRRFTNDDFDDEIISPQVFCGPFNPPMASDKSF